MMHAFFDSLGLVETAILIIMAVLFVCLIVWQVSDVVKARKIRSKIPQEQMDRLEYWWSCLRSAPDSLFSLVGPKAAPMRIFIEVLAGEPGFDRDGCLVSLSEAGLLDVRKYDKLQSLDDSPTDDLAQRTWLDVRPDVVVDYNVLTNTMSEMLAVADARTDDLTSSADQVASFVWKGLSEDAKKRVAGLVGPRWRREVEYALAAVQSVPGIMLEVDERRLGALTGIARIYETMREARDAIADAAASTIDGEPKQDSRWSWESIAYAENERRYEERERRRHSRSI